MTTLLIVDDNENYRREMGEYFQNKGYHVQRVADLRAALIEVQYLQPGDLVVTDKNLGEHRGIIPLLNYLQSEKPDVKVIIASGEVSLYATKELYHHGFYQKGGESFTDLVKMIEQLSPP